MSGRERDIRAFLAAAGWETANRVALAGDLSARRYDRLTRDGDTAILMDADPAHDVSTPAFCAMTRWLRSAGLSAPDILAADPENGLLLLEDLGDSRVSGLPPRERAAVYPLIIDLLLHLRQQKPPALARPDPSMLIEMTRLADQHYPGLDSDALVPFRALLETVFEDLLTDPTCVSLRDFHADNLMWLPDRTGLARLGLLDYQDAFITHPVYDLVSLLTDARTDIAPAFRQEMTALYAQRSGDHPVRLSLAFAAFALQRNLRILGIFTRSAAQGKPAHLPKLPRVRGYIAEALDHPAFAQMKNHVLAAIPERVPA